MATDTPRIIRTLDIPISVDLSWDLLVNENTMKEWLGADVFVIDPYEGGEIKIPWGFDDQAKNILGDIGLVQPKQKFVFTWREQAHNLESWFNNSSICFELEELDSGTRIHFVHEGFQYLPEEIRASAIPRYEAYWNNSKLDELQSILMSEAEKAK